MPSSATGTLSHKHLFCELGSDGMTIDNEGNVYLTGKGVTVFDKTGKQIEHIPIAEDWTGKHLFRRQRPPHPVHHGQQEHLRNANARERGRQPVEPIRTRAFCIKEKEAARKRDFSLSRRFLRWLKTTGYVAYGQASYGRQCLYT